MVTRSFRLINDNYIPSFPVNLPKHGTRTEGAEPVGQNLRVINTLLLPGLLNKKELIAFNFDHSDLIKF